MSSSRLALSLAAASAAAAVLIASGSASTHSASPGRVSATGEPTRHATAMWFRPASKRELFADASLVVYGEVEEVSEGPRLGDTRPGHELASFPTERIRVRVVESYVGDDPPEVTVFRTGGPDFSLEGDPPYRVGERHLLFLRPRADDPGVEIPVGPDGRLRELSDGRLRAVIEGGVAEELAGRTREAVGAEARELRRRSNEPGRRYEPSRPPRGVQP